MIGKLWHLLTHIKQKEYLPKTPRDFRVAFDEKQLSDDERLVLSAMRARDVSGVHKYLERKKTDSAYDVLDLIQSKPVADKKRRFISWLMRIFGETPTDRVMSQYFREQREKEKGIYTNHLS